MTGKCFILFRTVGLGACFLAPVAVFGQLKPLDFTDDGLGDVWQKYYQAEHLSSLDDDDGDGASNAEESAAGTDPRSPKSTLRISKVSRLADGVSLQWPTQVGKFYQVQWTRDLKTWVSAEPLQSGTGGEVTFQLRRPTSKPTLEIRPTLERWYSLDAFLENNGLSELPKVSRPIGTLELPQSRAG